MAKLRFRARLLLFASPTAVTAVLLAGGYAGWGGGTRSPEQPQPTEAAAGANKSLTWDLRQSPDAAAVGWPGGLRKDQLWVLDGVRLVTIRLPGGRDDQYFIDKALVSRNGDKVSGISLQFPAESVEEVYAHATVFAKMWGLHDQKALRRMACTSTQGWR